MFYRYNLLLYICILFLYSSDIFNLVINYRSSTMLNAVHTILKYHTWWGVWLVLRTCSMAAQCQLNDDSSATHVNITFPEVCPLGEALRSGEGRLIKCNCPPHPFCPLLYYCKMVEHGQAGICCPDFRKIHVLSETNILCAILTI